MKALLVLGMLGAGVTGVLAARWEDYRLFGECAAVVLLCFGWLYDRFEFCRDRRFMG